MSLTTKVTIAILPVLAAGWLASILAARVDSFSSIRSSIGPFLIGFGTACTLVLGRGSIVKLLSASSSSGGVKRDSQIYGLEHGMLNLNPRPDTWWMNMGYWKEQSLPENLPRACQALLDEVLRKAGILPPSQSPTNCVSSQLSPATESRVHIIDVGFGCGDQTIAISELMNVESYIGITIDKQQLRFAEERLTNLGVISASGRRMKLFQADAAQPTSWPSDLKQAIQGQLESTLHLRHTKSSENWLLALDTLYHFHPSRQALLRFAHNDLNASTAAFDLLLTDTPLTWMQYLMLRLVCLASSSPFSNFLTSNQYRKQLHTAGYSDDNIEIVDISDHVFRPLAQFLEHRDRQLRIVGSSIGRFRAARSLFAWWGRTGLVRGCIVIARVAS